MTIEEIRRIAEDVLKPTLGPHGLDHAEIRLEDNQDGEPSIFVVAHFRKGSAPTPGRASLAASGDLARAFYDVGELRFPYLVHRFEDDEMAVD